MSQNSFRTRVSSTTAMAKQRMARELAKSRNPKWLQKPPTTPSAARASKTAPPQIDKEPNHG